MTIVKSSSYMLASKVIETILSLSLLAILARLIDPKDFGIFAIVLAVQSLLQPLISVGLSEVYIKSNDTSMQFKNSLFSLNIILGGINFIIILVVSPFISIIYENEILLYIMLLFSISILISSYGQQAQAQLLREKSFDKIMVTSLIASIFTFFITTYLAYQGYGIWVLVLRTILHVFFTTFMMVFFAKTCYSFVSVNIIKKYTSQLKFGLEIFINRVLNGIYNSSDKFIFGKLFGLEYLGHYSNAQNIARMSDTHIRMPLHAAMYSYVERYTKLEKRYFYDKFLSIIVLITSMFSGALILEGDKIILFVLGQKWIFASEYIGSLAMFGMGMVFKGLYTFMSMSENKMKIQNITVALSLVVFFLIAIFTYVTELKISEFVILYSLTFFIYWLIGLFYGLYKNGSTNKYLLQTVIFVFILIMSLLQVKEYLADNIFSFYIIVGSYLSILIMTIFYRYKKDKYYLDKSLNTK